MQVVSLAFLLTVAQIVATLLGLLIVASFFYIDTGLRRLSDLRGAAEPYFRATTKIIIAMYGFAFATSLALVAFAPWAARLVFVAGAVYLVVATAEWAVRSRPNRVLARRRRVLNASGRPPLATGRSTLLNGATRAHSRRMVRSVGPNTPEVSP